MRVDSHQRLALSGVGDQIIVQRPMDAILIPSDQHNGFLRSHAEILSRKAGKFLTHSAFMERIHIQKEPCLFKALLMKVHQHRLDQRLMPDVDAAMLPVLYAAHTKHHGDPTVIQRLILLRFIATRYNNDTVHLLIQAHLNR